MRVSPDDHGDSERTSLLPGDAGTSASFRLSAANRKSIEELERGAKQLLVDDDDSDLEVGDLESVHGLLTKIVMEEDEDLWSIDSGYEDDQQSDYNHDNEVKRREEQKFESQPDDLEVDLHMKKRQSLQLLATLPDLNSIGLDDQKRTSFSSTSITLGSKRVLDRVHESTRALHASAMFTASKRSSRASLLEMMKFGEDIEKYKEETNQGKRKRVIIPTVKQICTMMMLTLVILLVIWILLALGTIAVGPPRQPVGEYKIIEAQLGEAFFQFYDFYAGRDSAGSNGYNMYVSQEVAEREGIVRVVTEIVPQDRMIRVYDDVDGMHETDWLKEDLEFLDKLKKRALTEREYGTNTNTTSLTSDNYANLKTKQSNDSASAVFSHDDPTVFQKDDHYKTINHGSISNGNIPKLEAFNADSRPTNDTNSTTYSETFVVLSSSPTKEGPRNSIRLEGRRRFNRGLFIIDLRHMPAGCGTWPAFWLTDEANWPVNGEIDIVEGVNYQDTAKTALHTTRECRMDDVPEGSKTGTWDTAVGIPDKKTGIPDMTFRFAQDCFVYDPHQWINQGCVATDLKMEGRSLGVPLNSNGGGVYALEWDPINTHIRTWVFSPHERVPKNLRDALKTATNSDEDGKVAPDTNLWGLPYGHFPIGDGTSCPSEHFRNMRLVINLAFCGSVSGNRYFMDCPKQFKQFTTCEQWVKSNPEELKEAYWKIRGVYVYEREWQKKWS